MTFSRGVRELARKMRFGYCWVFGCMNKGAEYHHRLPNTKHNNMMYPNFIHSLINCAYLCYDCHRGHKKADFNLTSTEAMGYELWLKSIKKGRKHAIRSTSGSSAHDSGSKGCQ